MADEGEGGGAGSGSGWGSLASKALKRRTASAASFLSSTSSVPAGADLNRTSSKGGASGSQRAPRLAEYFVRIGLNSKGSLVESSSDNGGGRVQATTSSSGTRRRYLRLAQSNHLSNFQGGDGEEELTRTRFPVTDMLSRDGFAPIVELAVLYPKFRPDSEKECIAAGFTVLRETYFGTNGNTNDGSVGGNTAYICYRRASSAAETLSPIVEIDLWAKGKEPLREGFECVEKIVGGGAQANLNGGIGGRKLFVVYKRLGAGVDTAKFSPRALARYTSSPRPITDICMVNASRKEVVPRGYVKVQRSTNNGNWTGKRLHICFKRASPYGMLDHGFAASVEDRYPVKNHADFPCPDHLPIFCAPQGIMLQRRAPTDVPLPEYCTFVLTDDEGSRTFCACLSVFEPVEDELAQNLEHDYDCFLKEVRETYQRTLPPVPGEETGNLKPGDGEYVRYAKSCEYVLQHVLPPTTPPVPPPVKRPSDMRKKGVRRFSSLMPNKMKRALSRGKTSPTRKLYAPTLLCLVSRWPFFTGMKKFLMQLYQIQISRSSFPIEAYIVRFLQMLPMPYAGGPTISLRFGSRRSAQRSAMFSIPPSRGLPVCDLDMRIVFEYLPAKVFAKALSLVLIEQKIVISCKYRSLLTKFAEIFTALMFPMKWQCVYVPVCPNVLLHVLEAPMPFILGISSEWTAQHGLPPGVWEIQLDTGTIVSPESSLFDSSIDFALPSEELPSKYITEFVKVISLVQSKQKQVRKTEKAGGTTNPDLAFDLVPPSNLHASKFSSEYFRKTVRSAALSLLSTLLEKYRSFLIPPDRSADAFWKSAGNVPEFNPNRKYFDVERFIAASPKPLRPYLRRLVRTQAFSAFVEERTYFGNEIVSIADTMTYFDNAIDMQIKAQEDATTSKRGSLDVRRSKLSGNVSGRFASAISTYGSPSTGKRGRSKGHAINLVEALEAYDKELRTEYATGRMEELRSDEHIVFDVEDICCEPGKVYAYDAFPFLDPELILQEEKSCIKQTKTAKSKSMSLVSASLRASLSSEEGFKGSAQRKLQTRSLRRRWSHPALRTVDEYRIAQTRAESAHAIFGGAPASWCLFNIQQVFGAWFSCVPHFMQLSSMPRRALLQGITTMERMWNENLDADETCYRALMIACEIGGESFASDAFRLFETMQESGIVASSITFGCFTSAVTKTSGVLQNDGSTNAMRRWERLRIVFAMITAFKRAGRTYRAAKLGRPASGRILSPIVRNQISCGGSASDHENDDFDEDVIPLPRMRLRRAESAKTILSYMSAGSRRSLSGASLSPPRFPENAPRPPPFLFSSTFGLCMYETVFDLLDYKLAPRTRIRGASRAYQRGRGLSQASGRSNSRRRSILGIAPAFRGRLVVACLRASGLKLPMNADGGLFGDSSPLCDLYVEATLLPSGQKARTSICKNGGRFPSWVDDVDGRALHFSINESSSCMPSLNFCVMSRVLLGDDCKVSEGSLNIQSALATSNVTVPYTVPLESEGEQFGELEVVVEFLETAETDMQPRLSFRGSLAAEEMPVAFAAEDDVTDTTLPPHPNTPEIADASRVATSDDVDSVILMWSQCRCLGCFTEMLDEEIMAGWSPRSLSASAVPCPSCGHEAVPTLHFRALDPSSSALYTSPDCAPREGSLTGMGPVEGAWEYMSPMMVRGRIEMLILCSGVKAVTRNGMRELDPSLYWNVLWYCCRLGLSFPIWDGHQEPGDVRSVRDEQVVLGHNYMALYEMVVNEYYPHLQLRHAHELHIGALDRPTSWRSAPLEGTELRSSADGDDDEFLYAEAAAAAAVASQHHSNPQRAKLSYSSTSRLPKRTSVNSHTSVEMNHPLQLNVSGNCGTDPSPNRDDTSDFGDTIASFWGSSAAESALKSVVLDAVASPENYGPFTHILTSFSSLSVVFEIFRRIVLKQVYEAVCIFLRGRIYLNSDDFAPRGDVTEEMFWPIFGSPMYLELYRLSMLRGLARDVKGFADVPSYVRGEFESLYVDALARVADEAATLSPMIGSHDRCPDSRALFFRHVFGSLYP